MKILNVTEDQMKKALLAFGITCYDQEIKRVPIWQFTNGDQGSISYVADYYGPVISYTSRILFYRGCCSGFLEKTRVNLILLDGKLFDVKMKSSGYVLDISSDTRIFDNKINLLNEKIKNTQRVLTELQQELKKEESKYES